ncbi:MAG: hypothetical protein O2780_11905 [Proteobacteria bacterium]|nr:hypothetical protein [Pseudomonadota bacterium]MDA1300790.1 hypothetical protein [Pseudomonadota bacterium]
MIRFMCGIVFGVLSGLATVLVPVPGLPDESFVADAVIRDLAVDADFVETAPGNPDDRDADLDTYSAPDMASGIATDIAPDIAPDITPDTDSGVDPETESGAGVDLDLAYQKVWSSFRSETSARGFADRMSRLLATDLDVVKLAPGQYEVRFPWKRPEERSALLDDVAALTGFRPPEQGHDGRP